MRINAPPQAHHAAAISRGRIKTQRMLAREMIQISEVKNTSVEGARAQVACPEFRA